MAKKNPGLGIEYPLVMVRWKDANGGNKTGWRPLRDVKKLRPCCVVSVGFKVFEDKETVVVCPHVVGAPSKEFDVEEVDGDGEIAIPRSWVLDIKVLKWD